MIIMLALFNISCRWSERATIPLTCIINKIRGFVELYSDGFAPSRMPPCGGARAVAVVVAEVTVVVSMSVTVRVIVAILKEIRLTASNKS